MFCSFWLCFSVWQMAAQVPFGKGNYSETFAMGPAPFVKEMVPLATPHLFSR